MYSKRHYDERGRIKALEIIHTGLSAEQELSRDQVDDGLRNGWMSIADGKLTIKTVESQPDLIYTIEKGPGHYCCHCGITLEDSKHGAAHVEERHAGEASPDSNNPSGWTKTNAWHLLLDAKQQERFQASKEQAALNMSLARARIRDAKFKLVRSK